MLRTLPSSRAGRMFGDCKRAFEMTGVFVGFGACALASVFGEKRGASDRHSKRDL